MSKMSKPEMDVVRFKENDIIVASGVGATIPKLSLFGFADDIPGNGYMIFNLNNKKYEYSDRNTLRTDLINAGYTDDIGISNVSALFRADYKGKNDESYYFTNGDYVWDAVEEYFDRQ